MATSIHSLPEELLAVIFEWTVHGNSRSYRRHRSILAQVSKAWGAVVENTPSLWSRISADYPPGLNVLSLARSRNAPLDVDFRIDFTPIEYRMPIVSSLVMACYHLPRWRTAQLNFGSHFSDQLKGLLSAPAPSLEEISIVVAPSQAFNPFLNLFGGQAGRLRSVCLVGICIPWGSGMLSGLEVLDLMQITHTPPTIQDILSILSSSSRLSTLKLSSVNFRDLPPESFSHPVIDLPYLQTLHIATANYRVIELILRHTRPGSSCTTLVLKCLLTGIHDAPSLLNLIPPFIPRLGTERGHVNLKLGFEFLSYTHSPPSDFLTQLDIGFTDFPTSTFFDPFFRTISLPLDTWITIKENSDSADVLTLLAAAPNVTKLELRSCGNWVLQRLAEQPWVFPRLTHLAIDMGDVTPGFLSRMIQARCGIRPESTDLPIPFVKVRVFGDDRHRHAADRVVLEAILGKDVLEWGVRGGLD